MDNLPPSHHYKPGDDAARTVSFPALVKSRSRIRAAFVVFARRIWSAVRFSEEPDAGLCEWLMEENGRLRRRVADSEARAEAAEAQAVAADHTAKALAMAFTALNAKLTVEAGHWERLAGSTQKDDKNDRVE